jgi:hypothetical protein
MRTVDRKSKEHEDEDEHEDGLDPRRFTGHKTSRALHRRSMQHRSEHGMPMRKSIIISDQTSMCT